MLSEVRVQFFQLFMKRFRFYWAGMDFMLPRSEKSKIYLWLTASPAEERKK